MSFAGYQYSAAFKRDYSKLSPELQAAVDGAIEGLLQHPIAAKWRFEKLQGYRNPNIYTIHVTPNHAYKLSLERRGDIAYLRRVRTHKEIDRSP